jgi:hypothetical protein
MVATRLVRGRPFCGSSCIYLADTAVAGTRYRCRVNLDRIERFSLRSSSEDEEACGTFASEKPVQKPGIRQNAYYIVVRFNASAAIWWILS